MSKSSGLLMISKDISMTSTRVRLPDFTLFHMQPSLHCMDWTLTAGQALRIIGAPTRLPMLELFQWCIIAVWSINR